MAHKVVFESREPVLARVAPPNKRRSVPWKWVAVLAPGLALYFAPLPSLTPGQRHLLAIFIATIIGMGVRPVAMGLVAFIGMAVVAVTRAVPYATVFSGFSNSTVWLIFCAFLFARAVTVTRLGIRIAYVFIRRFGHSALTLAYSITASDTVLAPLVPSDTARGGIIYPIARSVARAFDSEPGPTAGRLGSYLILVAFHSTYVSSAMFLTGMAANPLIAEFAMKTAHVELTWTRWMIGAAVPGLLSLALVPYLLYLLAPPQVHDTSSARAMASAEIENMGPMSRQERSLLAILLAVMIGWITASWHGVPNTIVALTGVTAILLAGVLRWEELLGEQKAWETLIWFASILMMAEALQQQGVITILSHPVLRHVESWPWMLSLAVLVGAYLYVHYGFASMTAQITALYPGFLATAVAAGVPPLAGALALAYFSNLNAGITHYGTGSAPVYFAEGYVPVNQWWRLGFLLSLANLALWFGLGMVWWKLLGWW